MNVDDREHKVVRAANVDKCNVMLAEMAEHGWDVKEFRVDDGKIYVMFWRVKPEPEDVKL